MAQIWSKNAIQVAGSITGGISETQEMLDFAANTTSSAMSSLSARIYINEAYERMLKSDVKYRFVIDIASMKQTA